MIQDSNDWSREVPARAVLRSPGTRTGTEASSGEQLRTRSSNSRTRRGNWSPWPSAAGSKASTRLPQFFCLILSKTAPPAKAPPSISATRASPPPFGPLQGPLSCCLAPSWGTVSRSYWLWRPQGDISVRSNKISPFADPGMREQAGTKCLTSTLTPLPPSPP